MTKVYLAANPSHLEAVDPVLEGIVRAKQDRLDLAGEAFTVLPVLMHGDAAFAGQGVVAETLNLSQLRGYRTGGTIHVVINNQVGFTTSPSSSRSSFYSTDVARMIQAPIFHVNGDDPEACVRVAELAYEFRQEFNKDVVIDMVCYRRRGHNEGDDPSMTQPLMYNLIEAKRSVRKLYTEPLIGRGDITRRGGRGGAARLPAAARAGLRRDQGGHPRATAPTPAPDALSGSDAEGHGGLERPSAQEADEQTPTRRTDTAITAEDMQHIGDAFVNMPEGFTAAPQAAAAGPAARRDDPRGRHRLGDGRAARVRLAAHGGHAGPAGRAGLAPRHVRAAARRPHRQGDRRGVDPAALPRRETRRRFWLYDSLLSEFAALGFEYGYSVERPDALVLWEAQFGDFVNGAQTIIDEFISSSEQKWGQRSSVVLLLPHGYEGQGPDHSSARIERFLQLCAEDNMTVAYPSTPASYFHLLRRQAYARPRRPLIVFTPKSMLRLKAAASGVEEFTSGGVPPGAARPGAAGRRRGDPGAARLRQGRLRPRGRAHQARGHQHGDPAGRAARAAAGRRDRRRAAGLPGRRDRLGAGRAGQPGRVAVHGH